MKPKHLLHIILLTLLTIALVSCTKKEDPTPAPFINLYGHITYKNADSVIVPAMGAEVNFSSSNLIDTYSGYVTTDNNGYYFFTNAYPDSIWLNSNFTLYDSSGIATAIMKGQKKGHISSNVATQIDLLLKSH